MLASYVEVCMVCSAYLKNVLLLSVWSNQVMSTPIYPYFHIVCFLANEETPPSLLFV